MPHTALTPSHTPAPQRPRRLAHTPAPRWLALTLALFALMSCRTEGELFIAEASLISDATEGFGPYQVDIQIQSRRAVRDVSLFWRTQDMDTFTRGLVTKSPGDLLHYRGTIAPLETLDDEGLTTREPFALGTRVQWFVTAFDANDAVAQAPFEAPDEVYAFTVGPPRQPVTVAEVSPPQGPSTGGTRVFIRGTGFRQHSEVLFGPNLASDVRTISAQLLEVVTPASNSGGLTQVVVRAPGGAAGRLDDAFFFIAPPRPTLVNPDRGPTTGGTRVTIAGTDFDNGAQILFNDSPAQDVVILDPNTALATSPPGPPGPATLAVINPDGQRGDLDDAFIYVPPPLIERLQPDFGPVDGGTRVTISGDHFQDGARVFFDNLEAQQVTFDGPRSIQATTPPHPAGLADITVVNPDAQRATNPEAFTYLGPPRVDGIDPDQGSTLGGTRVIVSGDGFFLGMRVTLDGLDCTQVVVESPTLATCDTPAHPEGLVDLTVTNLDGQSDTLRRAYTYIPPPPQIDEISPDRGSDLGGTLVTIRVRFGQDGLVVNFDGTPAVIVDITFEGDTAIVVIQTPPHPEGRSDVEVINPDGQRDLQTDAYLFVGPPIIDDITPDVGPDTGGQRVTITGRNFLDGLSVSFDGLPATVVSVDPDAGVAVVTTPAHPVGLVDVTITNPDQRSDVADSAYEYVLRPPEIDALEPSQGAVWGGTNVTITGAGFQPGVQLRVAGLLVEVDRVDANTLTFVTPPGVEGLADVVVTNPDSQSDEATFSYIAPRLSPSQGLTAGFTNLRVTGADFDQDTTVRFAGAPPVEVIFISDTELEVITPPNGVGGADVTFVTGAGLGDTFEDAFTYTLFVDRTARSGLLEEPGCLEIEAGDIDGDGDDDLALANGGLFQDNNINVTNALYTSGNNGLFSRRTLNFAENSMNMDFADIDQDGDLDLFVGNLAGRNRLYFNDGDGGYLPAVNTIPIERESYDAGFVDANNDGAPDIFLVNTADQENLFINNGRGAFTDRSDLLPPTDASEHDHDFHFADLNGDGDNDIIIGVDNTRENDRSQRYQADNRIFFSGGGGGRFTLDDDNPFSALEGDFLEVQIGDVNLDGLPDIVTVDNIDQSAPRVNPVNGEVRNGVQIFLNTGGGNFRAAPELIDQDLVGPAVSFVLHDVDQDGDLDLIVAVASFINDLTPINPRGQPNWLFVNRGDGQFIDATASWPAQRDLSWDVAVFDANGDQLLDLVWCNYLTPNRLLIQTSTP